MERNNYLSGCKLIFLTLVLLISSCSRFPSRVDPVDVKGHASNPREQARQAYEEENYVEAVQYYQQALDHNRDDAIIAYNLACSYALLGDAEQAGVFVLKAFGNGFRNIEWFNKDQDFNSIRNDPKFKRTLEEIKEQFESAGQLQYVEAPSLQPYRIRFPEDFDPEKRYPLLIGLHGMGGNADGFISIYDHLENPEILYVTPEGQYSMTMNIGPQRHTRSWGILNVPDSTRTQADHLVSEYILDTIDKVSADYNVSDVYLLGFSQGAVFAYTIGLQNADRIKGVIGFSGYLMEIDRERSILSSDDLEQGKNLRLYIAHGIDDAAISVEDARKLKTLFEDKGFDVTYEEFKGRHGIEPDIFNDAVKWMQ